MTEVDRATDRLLDTVGRLPDADVSGPSLLPGWTRGHVLVHLARNADGLTRLLDWARTGVPTPQYAGREARHAEIEAGAGRPAADHLADLRETVARFAAAAEAMPPGAWATVLQTNPPQPAAAVVWRRLREVEVHHVDLAAGYGTTDWPDGFSHRLLHEVVAGLRDRSDVPTLTLHATDLGHDLAVGRDHDNRPTVTGRAHALAGWLIGRAPGDSLTVDPPGALPEPPTWM